MQIMSNLPLAPISFLSDKVNEDEKQYFENHSGLIIDTERVYGLNVKLELLDEALKSIRKKSAFNQIITEYPALYEASIKMANYFTHLTPADGGMSLLSKSLMHGIDGFNKAHKEFYMSNDPSIKMASFIKGASLNLHEILLNQIYGKHQDSWVQWRPVAEPILDWIRRYQFTQVLIVPTSERVNSKSFNVAANKLLFEIFNFTELSLCGISSVNQVSDIHKNN